MKCCLSTMIFTKKCDSDQFVYTLSTQYRVRFRCFRHNDQYLLPLLFLERAVVIKYRYARIVQHFNDT